VNCSFANKHGAEEMLFALLLFLLLLGLLCLRLADAVAVAAAGCLSVYHRPRCQMPPRPLASALWALARQWVYKKCGTSMTYLCCCRCCRLVPVAVSAAALAVALAIIVLAALPTAAATKGLRKASMASTAVTSSTAAVLRLLCLLCRFVFFCLCRPRHQ